jgi:hypothetical protein
MQSNTYSSAVQQFVTEMQQQLATQVQAVAVLANSAYRDSSGDTTSAGSSAVATTTTTTAAADVLTAAQQRIARVQPVHASTGQRGHQLYTIDTELLATLHTQRGETGVNVLCNMLVAPPGWSTGAAITCATVANTAATSTTTSTAADTVKYLQFDEGVDYSELGFECVLQYYYTAIVQGATYGTVDTEKLRATLQAAQFFSLDTLAAAAKQFAQDSGVPVQ